MSLMKNLMIDLMNDERGYTYAFKWFDEHTQKFKQGGATLKGQLLNELKESTNNNKWKIDLPYLDLSKLTSYVENGYLIIKYNNPDDSRRKSYEYTVYVGDADVNIKYENGFLIIEREEKKPERKFINVSSK